MAEEKEWFFFSAINHHRKEPTHLRNFHSVIQTQMPFQMERVHLTLGSWVVVGTWLQFTRIIICSFGKQNGAAQFCFFFCFLFICLLNLTALILWIPFTQHTCDDCRIHASALKAYIMTTFAYFQRDGEHNECGIMMTAYGFHSIAIHVFVPCACVKVHTCVRRWACCHTYNMNIDHSLVPSRTRLHFDVAEAKSILMSTGKNQLKMHFRFRQKKNVYSRSLRDRICAWNAALVSTKHK